MDRRLRRADLDPPERAGVRDVVYGVLRHRRLLDHLLQGLSKMRLSGLERAVLLALRIGAYRILFQGGAAASLAVKETVDLVSIRKSRRARGFVNGVLRSLCRSIQGPLMNPQPVPPGGRDLPFAGGGGVRFAEPTLPDPEQDLPEFLSLAYSHPRWIVDRWLENLGRETAIDTLRTGCQRAPFTIRTNRLRITREDLLRRLQGRDLDAESGEAPEAIRIRGGRAVLSTPEFGAGLFYVQDETPMKVAPFLDLRPGLRCLDLCASPGGKSTHMAEAMGNDGQVIACDISGAKLERIEENCRRLGVLAVSTALLDREEETLPFGGTFDRILVDAPCSNSGVLRRRPEARWRLDPESIANHHRQQLLLLEKAAPLLAPDGVLVYSTCSLEPEENRDVVGEFLDRRIGYFLRTDLQVLPLPEGPDGGYMARIERQGG